MDKLLPLVSVIVPVYNGEIFLEKCLQSVICQSYTNIEIIVVNDGSIDNTSLIIRKPFCPKSYPAEQSLGKTVVFPHL